MMAREPILADHTITGIRRIEEIPIEWIRKAKDSLVIAYQHTSHGQQFEEEGLKGVEAEYGSDFAVNIGIEDDDPEGLDIRSRAIKAEYGGPKDLGNGDNNWWVSTRKYLDAYPEVNVAMWSFCGGASKASEEQITEMLAEGDSIEKDYPNVRFVYMTGHTDGKGYESTLHRNNELIRHFCRENGKILFDFADIESFAPDGRDMMALSCDDACNYREEGERKNWATEWCDTYPEDCYYRGHCAHSKSLNCQLKGEAAWWMFARMVGWEGFGSTDMKDGYRRNSEMRRRKTIGSSRDGMSIYDIRGRLISITRDEAVPEMEPFTVFIRRSTARGTSIGIAP